MDHDKNSAEANLHYLRQIMDTSAQRLSAHRRIFILWGVVVGGAGLISQLLVLIHRTEWIPLVWGFLVTSGFVGSIVLSRRVRSQTHVNPVLLRHLGLIWAGGTLTITTFFLFSALAAVFSIEYLAALSFPVIGVCTLITASSFRSRAGFALAGMFFLAALPAVVFPSFGMALQAVLIGGGLFFLGMTRNA